MVFLHIFNHISQIFFRSKHRNLLSLNSHYKNCSSAIFCSPVLAKPLEHWEMTDWCILLAIVDTQRCLVREIFVGKFTTRIDDR